MAYFQVMAIAVFFTIVLLWRPNFLSGIVAMASWFAMLAFHMIERPSGVIEGSTVDNIMVLGYLGMAVALPIMTLVTQRRQRRKESGEDSHNATPPKTLSNMNEAEYRKYIRARMKRK